MSRRLGRVLGGVLVLCVALPACAEEEADDVDHTPDAAGNAHSPLPSAGCGAEGGSYPVGTTPGELTVAGVPRTFRVHVPPGHRALSPSPLVLMFHGGGGSGRQLQEVSSRMDSVADREGFVTVYPDGSGVLRTWNGGACCGYAVTNAVDDVGFVTALLDHLESELCVDRRRVFSSGMSNGGIMSHRLACELSDRVAAIAPVAGTNMTSACTPSRPVPVMQIHGTSDGHVPWEGGEGCGPAGVPFTSVSDTLDGWRTKNGCGSATSLYFEEGDGRCETYGGCANGADVTLCTIAGGGHNWPGGEPPAGRLVPCPADGIQSSTFSASEAAWRFFAEHPMAAL